jgi:hypothetical protein
LVKEILGRTAKVSKIETTIIFFGSYIPTAKKYSLKLPAGKKTWSCTFVEFIDLK